MKQSPSIKNNCQGSGQRCQSQRGRASGTLLLALAAVIAGLLALLMLRDPGPSTHGVDAPLGVDPQAPAASDSVPDMPPKARDTSASETRDDDGERTLVDLAEAAPDAAPVYRLEILVVNREGRALKGSSVQVLEPSMDLELIETTNGIASLELTEYVPHVMQVMGPEIEGLHYIEETIEWTPVPSQSVGQIKVALYRGARIQGSLHCSDGSSARSAGIDIFHVETEEWTNAAAIEDGTFISQWMPPGEVIVYSRNGSWSGDDLKEREILSLSEGQTYSYHGTLAPAIDLIGTVVDAAGRPLGNVPVDVYDEANPVYSESVISGADGRFLCNGLYPGTYLLDLPKSDATPKARFTVPRGRKSVDMGNLVHR